MYFPKIKLIFHPEVDIQKATFFITKSDTEFKKMFFPEKIRFNTNKKTIIQKRKIIKEYTEDYYNHNSDRLKKKFNKIQNDWRMNEKKFFDLTNKIFKDYSWPKGKYIGFGTIFNAYPRWISEKTFLFPLNYKNINLAKKVIGHELLHFIFFDYVEKKYGLTENNIKNNHLWKISEAFNSVIEEWEPYRKIFHSKSNPYPQTISIYKKMKKQWKEFQDIDLLLNKWLK